jgi:allantoicase
MGNFPESCELQACFSTSSSVSSFANQEWINILPRTKLGPHRRHYFQLENVKGSKFSHVKLTIWPDGGLKRLRIIGRRIEGTDAFAAAMMLNGNGVNGNGVNGHGHVINGVIGHHAVHTNGTNGVNGLYANGGDTRSPSPSFPPTPATPTPTTIIPALPLTPEAFAPFGQVLQAYADHNAAPRKTKITPANQGSAFKFHKLAPIRSSYPVGSGATPALSIYRCKPIELDFFRQCELNMLERHPYTNQAFIPMGPGDENGLTDPGKLYLVVVAKNAEDGGPDLGTLRAFVASAAQGIVYDTAVWRERLFHPFSKYIER